MASPTTIKNVEHPHAPSKPPQTAEIIKSLGTFIPPDSESPQSIDRRNARIAPPRRAGASQSGRRKDNPPV